MKNRIPTRPGRMKITPEEGGTPYYATVEMADEPSEVGTPLNKETFLSDETSGLYGLNQDTVPDDIFKLLSKAAMVGDDGNLTTIIGGNVPQLRAVYGSYIGTGNGAKTLSFSFTPYLVMVDSYIFFKDKPENVYDSNNKPRVASWGSQFVAFYHYSDSWFYLSLNSSGVNYRYFAIGVQ